jgi:hypothetical protein
MSAHPIVHIASVNMRKRNAVTHALLNSNKNAHIILVQEPWFDKIGTARKDDARQGVDVLGGVACPKWELTYPGFTEGTLPKVMAYSRKPTQSSINTPRFTIVPRLDICSHPTLQVLDIVFDDNRTWQIINFYHDVRDNTSLQALLSLDIDALTPTLVVGDFNTHSQTWSPPDMPRSLWAARIEEWAALNLLMLANNPGEITRKGAGHERDSVIDLAWYNEAATEDTTFSDLTINWEGSLGSDHAMLTIAGHTQEEATAPNCENDLGFLIDPERSEEWIRAFKARSLHPPFRPSPSPDEVEIAAASLTKDIQQTNDEVLRKRRPAHPRASPWWNAACAIATRTLQDATGAEARKIAHGRLKGTVRAAKRKWANEYIEKAQLLEVAAWRHGRRLSKVPSLRGTDGLVHSHEGVADILSKRFFPPTPQEVDPHFLDDPPPTSTSDARTN